MCMYLCMHVCIYVCMYLCKYVCMYLPVMRLRRINSIRGNDDPIIQTLPNNIILKWLSPRYYDNISFSSNINIKQYHTDYLINLADG